MTMLGKNHTLETKEKIRKANKGKHLTEETKDKLRLINLGKKHSEEHILKLKENAKNNLNYGMRCKHFSMETREKMRKSRLEGIKNGSIKIWNTGIKTGRLIRKTPMEEVSRKIVKTRRERKNYSHTEESRKKISAIKQGIPLDKWEKFISREPYDQNWTNKFKRAIRKRDNQICMNCGIHREKLNESLTIHHINYDKKLSIPGNCISLCRRCHTLTNMNREYWINLFQEKLNKLYSYQYSIKREIVHNI